MAFKSFNQYQEDKNGEFFVLPNDKDYADVIFLYRSAADVLIAEGVHYLSTRQPLHILSEPEEAHFYCGF